ncbi:MAG: hypothetical protein WBN93_11360 [Acidimicrobiia bacterium]
MNTRGFVGLVVVCVMLAACTPPSGDTTGSETTTTAAAIQTFEAPTSSLAPEMTSTTRSPSSTTGAKDAPDSTTAATKTTSSSAEWESVLPSDMQCEDFIEMDLGYEAALGYWFVSGRPNRMDTDGNGIPCDEEAYSVRLPVVGEGEDAWFARGLYCRDIVTDPWMGPDVPFLYWLIEGSPDRMDADRDGIPCETLFPEIVLSQFLEDPYLLEDGLPSGLNCEDLRWVRPFYRQAVAYYVAAGFPGALDDDGDGIPCESTGFEDELWDIEWVADTASGMSCDDLANSERFEHDYFGVVLYWLYHGRPAELDADRDGLPCHPGWGRSWSLQDVKWFTDGLLGYTNAC